MSGRAGWAAMTRGQHQDGLDRCLMDKRSLPQHNLDLPFPEGKHGRYVKFSNQANWIGWNNIFGEFLLNAHLAYVSNRAYVFQDYLWQPSHYPWPQETWMSDIPRTPLNAIVSGPISGGAFEPGNSAPRSVSEAWLFLDATEGCIEIVSASMEEDMFSQTFDLGLWATPRILTLWETFSNSPISRLLGPSTIVRSAVECNAQIFVRRDARLGRVSSPPDPYNHMLAMHLRRGDYEEHCKWLAYIDNGFYGWNQFPHLADRLTINPDAPDKDARFLEPGIVSKAALTRRDFLGHAGAPDALDTFYLLTNEKSGWIEEIKDALKKDGWAVYTTQDLVLDSEQTDVSMAVDMEIARRAAVFIGNGWSSFTSNIVSRRLADGRDPITIRFS
ncbi:hypothetical protein B0H14DRAFT_3673725 [Mycena olivaceomarginata]|nr:hypothetical protein B0H14DRAFT_3673725 [Mycena olivaceomarginata]